MAEIAIIVAGGTGARMQSEIPKQFINLNGEAIILHTIKKFITYKNNIQIIIVVHPEYKSMLQSLINESKINQQNIKITTGGNTRFDSVKNGLALIDNSEAIVGIHDAARPFVSIETITNCFSVAAKIGNAIPCISIHESIRETDGTNNKIANRDQFKIIQTPQCFLVSKIKNAFKQDYQTQFTDDASVLETTSEK